MRKLKRRILLITKKLYERSELTLGNNDGTDESGTPTEKRVRKDVKGKSGYEIGAR